jgi:hypothetical protein
MSAPERHKQEFHDATHKEVHRELHGIRDVPDVIKAGGIRALEKDTAAPVGTAAPKSRPDRLKHAHIEVDTMKERLTKRSTLRELFILKELIDAPMALRDRPVGAE